MSEQTRVVLKTYFETGDKPTQAEFIDTLDSLPNFIDDKAYRYIEVSLTQADIRDLNTINGGKGLLLISSQGVAKAIAVKSAVVLFNIAGGFMETTQLRVQGDAAQVQYSAPLRDDTPVGKTIFDLQRGIVSSDAFGVVKENESIYLFTQVAMPNYSGTGKAFIHYVILDV